MPIQTSFLGGISKSAASRTERLFISATFITMLGNNIQLIATSLLVYKTAGTALAVGWVFILTAIPQVLLSAVFGRVADRVDRRKLCLVADTGSALTAFAFPIAILLKANASDAGYVVSFVLALFAAIFMPASNALFKERLPSDRLGHFSANYEIAYQGGSLLSGVVGGIVAQLIGLHPLFYFNALTFVGSAFCIFAVGRRVGAAVPTGAATMAAEADPVDPADREPPPAPVIRRPILRLAVLYGSGTVLITVVNTLLLVCIVFRFRQGAGLLGVVDALAGVGMMCAAAIYRRIKDKYDYRLLIMTGWLICVPLTTIEPIAVWVMVPCILVAATGFGLARVPTRAELMRGVDPSRVGRTFGMINASGLAVSVAATVVVALIVGHHDVVPGFIALGLICAVPAWPIAASLLASKTWAPVREQQPESAPAQ
jgi:Major Facilitator Superfamily